MADNASDGRFAEQHHVKFHKLLAFLSRVPAIVTNETPWAGFGSGEADDGNWWVKFTINVQHDLAWSTVQEMGYVLNGLSIEERLPTLFKPVSPPPYMNGGPEDYLSWVIESHDGDFSPSHAGQWLEGRMPDPVEDLTQWPVNQDD